VRLAEDGELLVRGPSLFKGYQGTDPGSCGIRPDGFLETGDLADIDEDGYIRILGRKKNILITSTGRNLSAEWIEGVLAGKPEIRAAVVFGDGGPFPVGMVIPRPGCPPADVLRAVRAANGELPVFARVRNLAMPRMGAGELRRYFTITGRPRREQLLKDFSETLAGLTRSMHPDLVRDQS
jgi:long-subunit acyl-CoA synthetase (AMP-forming)